MATVSELKDQARALEQKGEFDKALKIYQHILRHVEGTPAVSKVIPLYVKVGDLFLKLERTADARVAYEQAAELYAKEGAAQRVSALCVKLRRLMPDEYADAPVKYAGILVDSGHVGSARDVLAEYAQEAKLPDASDALENLAGRPSEEIQPMLESLLASLAVGEAEETEQAARRLSSQLMEVVDEAAGELESAADEPATSEPEEPPVPEPEPPRVAERESSAGFATTPFEHEPQVAPEFDPTAAFEPEPPEPHEPESEVVEVAEPEPAAPESFEDEREAPVSSEGEAHAEPEAPVSYEPEPPAAFEPEPPAAYEPETLPRQPIAVPAEPAFTRQPILPVPAPDRSRFVFGAGGAVVGLLAGIGLAMAGVIPVGGGKGQAVTGSAATTIPVSGLPAVPDTTAAEQLVAEVPGAVVDTTAESPGVVARTDTAAAEAVTSDVVVDTTAAVADTARTVTAPVEAPSDTQATPEASDTTTPETPTTVARGPIVIDGLPIREMFETEYQGAPGFRVVQMLDSLTPFTIESYPAPTTAPGPSRVGRLVVNATAGDTVVGVLRLETHMVYASGVVSEDSLRVLMTKLVEGKKQ
ncbi:MAG: hypothetical protein ACE5HT_06320 [Gemmatimonadales bacterium]